MRHGTLSMYKKAKCRCLECVTEANRYQKRLRFEHLNGRKRLVPSGPTIEHLNWLHAQGMSLSAIAAAMGYTSATVVCNLRRRTSVRLSTQERMLAVKLERSNSRSFIDSLGTARRLQALAWCGWTNAEIAKRAGLWQNTLSDLRAHRYPSVYASTAVTIANIYEELSLLDGGDELSRRKAIRMGWAPPMAWDDIDLDARPNGVAA